MKVGAPPPPHRPHRHKRRPVRHKIQPIGQVVDRMFHGFKGRSGELRLGTRIQKVWREVLGDTLATHLFPAGFHAGELVVGCRSGLWMGEARFLAEKIRAKLSEALQTKEIRVVRLKLMAEESAAVASSSFSREATPALPVETAPIASAKIEAMEEALRAVDDENLREQLRRIFEKAVRTGRSGPGAAES